MKGGVHITQNQTQKAERIRELCGDKNAVILAHNYQRPEVQDIADFVGDSLGLSIQASETDADIIIFCGVDFMAETAAVINPGKKVIMPDLGAMCPMAQQLHPDELIAAKETHPDADVVLYINTLAEAKALADCVCTSANTVKVIDAMKSDTVLFGPDYNLAYYTRQRCDKNIISVPEYGLCPTHHLISVDDVTEAMRTHPNAELVVHPETVPPVQDMADHIASTSGMITYCGESSAEEFIIGTETGLLHRLRKEMPDKKFYPATSYAICPTMKVHTLDKIIKSLENEQPQIKVPEDIAIKAHRAIERMLELK